MSEYYKAKRTYGLFNPNTRGYFKLSRSKIDLFINCPRCFYIDRKLGVNRPPMFPYTLNSAVDTLLKKEFDVHRIEKKAHPMMEHYNINAIPFEHEKMNNWRNAFVGVQYLHKPTNFLVFGAIDDIWINPQKELMIVDYKSTAKAGEITLDADWQISYKRQMEIYQWLFRKNDFKVSNTGYFVYANGKRDKEAFDKKLEFDVYVLLYNGNDDWVEKAITDAHQCLMSNEIPQADKDCDYCQYLEAVKEVEK
ncbi:PD-(D/E)XK nuclease family protein [Patescibacteria group bacterium]|nr:PD-(D/E)XK nuclease family protein [Patescibacteria group bacterium]MBU2472636.1 PD-(D/E)XK nuclease family protein [Patescibacteria group bacterium]